MKTPVEAGGNSAKAGGNSKALQLNLMGTRQLKHSSIPFFKKNQKQPT
jgi:hypothetical protein